MPAAIALTPILAARWRSRDLEVIRAAAPGARLVTIGFDGHPDGPLDDVEVMLRGRLPAETFDRILARAPELRWVHSATAGVERVLTPASRARGLDDHQRAGRVLAADRRVRDAHDPGRRRAACRQLLELQAERTWQPLESRELRDVTVGIVGLGSIGRAVGRARHGVRVPGHRDPPARRRRGPRPPMVPATSRTSGSLMLDRVLPPERLPELLAESDFVVLAAPLTADTAGLIGEDAIAAS